MALNNNRNLLTGNTGSPSPTWQKIAFPLADTLYGEGAPLGEKISGKTGPLGFLASMYLANQRQAGDKRTEAKGLIEGQLSDLNTFYNKEYYQDFMQTAEARSARALLERQMKDVMRSYENKGAATGATAEGRIAAKTGAQEKFSDALAQILGMSTQNKRGVRQDYMGSKGLLNNQLMNIFNQEASGYEQVASNVADTAGSAIQLGAAFI